jgi:hypothetical protein
MIPSRERLKVVSVLKHRFFLEFGLDSNHTDHHLRSPLAPGCCPTVVRQFQEFVQSPFRHLLDFYIGRAYCKLYVQKRRKQKGSKTIKEDHSSAPLRSLHSLGIA